MAGGKATYYAVLGVALNASAAEIRSAWRKLSLKWHPDKLKREDDNALFKERALARYLEIQEAYAVLSDRERKAMYDDGLRRKMWFDATTQNGKGGHGSCVDVMTAMMDRMKTDGEDDSDSDGDSRPVAAGGAGKKPWKKKGSSSPSSPATVRIDVSIKFTPAAGTSRGGGGGGSSGPRRPAYPRMTKLNRVLERKLRGRKDE